MLGQVPTRLAGSASGVVSTITQLAGVAAVTVTGAIFYGTLGNHPHPETFVHATTHSLWYLTASCAAAAIGCTLLPPGSRRALRTVAGEPFGPVLLILVALGLIAFGLLSFFEAKWRRTYGGVPV
ncbi:MAG: DUF1206 domain-containing protein [Streptosporangiaceae bacterium]